MDYKHYMPVLKWRQGEYQALFRLNKTIKSVLYPLFIVPPVEYDFEDRCPKKTAEAHVEKLVKRMKDKWGISPCLLDIDESLHLEKTSTGQPIPEYIFDDILKEKINCVPVLTIHHSQNYLNIIKAYITDKKSFALRVAFDDLADPDSITAIDDILSFMECDYINVELIIDFTDKVDYSEQNDLSLLLNSIMQLLDTNRFKSTYIIGTSLDLSIIKKPGAIQVRNEWTFFMSFSHAHSTQFSNLGYGDYTIETPTFISLDMRMLKPAAKLVYSSGTQWYVIKGSAFRDNPSQMHGICLQLVSAKGVYLGESFSNGDKKIYDCAHVKCGNGNMGTWKEAAVSHHLTLAVTQLSNFYEK
jgi:hypothetical protein